MSQQSEVGKEMVPSEHSPVMIGPVRDIVPVSVTKNTEVKSDTEVRHGIVHFLTEFSQLQLETNLNIPPSNWLRSSSKLEQHVKELAWQSTRRPSEFSSIDMAHNSPDSVGEVDVIAHAENIKKLLKMPFGQSHISMMVHRIGKSLLLDEFDIHQHLLRQEQADWRWLRKFYYDSVIRETMKCVPRQRKSRGHLQNRNMYSKFLYHSLGLKSDLTVELPITTDRHIGPPPPDHTSLPDPLPQPVGTQHHREVLWTFEDIRMLIGTDLPIFSGDSYYVSLRLRDMRTPVNVLTGLDYWLDNLMCNVPEVAMCFHINGIVKKYEVLKTEDIPNLENSKFDQTTVTDIAKNILAFLKTNATKEGHTYWLYKDSDDDIVKLYDLTALCGDDSTSKKEENPFTVPVGMLLYRVARNMWKNHGRAKAPVIRTLLENCLFLLDKEKHSQVCTSANYLLSDIYVPDSSMIQDDWTQPQSSSDSSDDDESAQDLEYEAEGTRGEDLFPSTANLDTKTLFTGNRPTTKELLRVRPVSESVEERCLLALRCIHKGLTCLTHDMNVESRHSSSIVEEQAQCNSDEAIPLHYEPINQNSSDTHESHLIQLTSMKHEDGGQSWHNLSKGLLLRKAAMTFCAMTKLFMTSNNYKSALRCLRASLCCYDGIPRKSKEYTDLLSCIFALGGDIRLVLTKSSLEDLDWNVVFQQASSEENAILEIVDTDTKEFGYQWVIEHGSCMETNLTASVNCYTEALELASRDERVSIAKRLGNAQNELGVWYMHEAQRIIQQEEIGDQPPQHVEKLWQNCKDHIVLGLQSFEKIRDTANQILLHCNIGRLMRLCAQTYTHITLRSDKQEFSSMERYYFNKALEEYKTALSLCGAQEAYRSLHESVTWEITTTYFNVAILLQDYAPLSTMSQDEVEKEIVELMNKSLKYCKNETTSAKQPMYQYRTATINHRLASMFHNSLRNQGSEHRRRHLRQLAENHYSRSVQQYQQMECSVEGLRVQLERFGLLEFCLTAQTNSGSRWRLLLQMLHLIIDCEELLSGLIKQLDEPDEQTKLQKDTETISNVMESRLQFTLLQLVLAFKANNKKAKKDAHLLEELKSLYARSLNQDKGNQQLQSLKGKCLFVQTCLREVSNFYHKVPDVNRDSQLSNS